MQRNSSNILPYCFALSSRPVHPSETTDFMQQERAYTSSRPEILARQAKVQVPSGKIRITHISLTLVEYTPFQTIPPVKIVAPTFLPFQPTPMEVLETVSAPVQSKWPRNIMKRSNATLIAGGHDEYAHNTELELYST